MAAKDENRNGLFNALSALDKNIKEHKRTGSTEPVRSLFDKANVTGVKKAPPVLPTRKFDAPPPDPSFARGSIHKLKTDLEVVVLVRRQYSKTHQFLVIDNGKQVSLPVGISVPGEEIDTSINRIVQDSIGNVFDEDSDIGIDGVLRVEYTLKARKAHVRYVISAFLKDRDSVLPWATIKDISNIQNKDVLHLMKFAASGPSAFPLTVLGTHAASLGDFNSQILFKVQVIICKTSHTSRTQFLINTGGELPFEICKTETNANDGTHVMVKSAISILRQFGINASPPFENKYLNVLRCDCTPDEEGQITVTFLSDMTTILKKKDIAKGFWRWYDISSYSDSAQSSSSVMNILRECSKTLGQREDLRIPLNFLTEGGATLKKRDSQSVSAAAIKNIIGLCPGCKRNVENTQDCFVVEGFFFHQECLHCHDCDLKLNTSSVKAKAGKLYCSDHFPSSSSKSNLSCVACKRQINDLSVKTERGFFHETCLSCSHCSKRLVKNSRIDPFVFKDNSEFEVLCMEHGVVSQSSTDCYLCKKPAVNALVFEGSNPSTGGDISIHQECFQCQKCEKTLDPLSGEYALVNGMLVCIDDAA